MICIDCGYEMPYTHMKQVGIRQVSCTICGATNENQTDFDCPSCDANIPYDLAKQHNGRNVPCTQCGAKHNFNLHPSSLYKIVPSVYDVLENPDTAMVPSPRAEQVKIADKIQNALHSNQSCIAEAGTGTGKTLAYLVPALAMGKRVIVATATKALQDQIMEEDGPWVLDSLKEMGIHRTIAARKGKGNFACVYDFLKIKDSLLAEAYKTGDTLAEGEVKRMQKWLDDAADGEHNSDLNTYPDPPEWVDRVRVDECAKDKCSKCNICGYYRNLGEVATADVVVTNHTLVALEYMVPAQLGEAGKHLKDFLFGDRQALIFDEAHQLEGAFENVWKEELKQFTLTKTLRKLNEFSTGPVPKSAEDKYFTARFTCWSSEEPETEEFTIEVGATYKGLKEVGSYDPKTGALLQRSIREFGDLLRYNHSDTAVISSEDAQRHRSVLGRIYACLEYIKKGIHDHVILLESHAKGHDEALRQEAIEELRDIRPAYRRLDRWIDLVESWMDMREDYVYYVKRFPHPKYDTSYAIIRQPIDMAKVLQKFWTMNKSVIFSSATMSTTVKGSPSFYLFQSRLGTEVPDENCVVVKSPFNFRKRCATYITRDKKLRPPKFNASSREKSQYFDNMANEISQWVRLTRGNALVLFASAYDLEQVYQRLDVPYPIHAQMNDTVPANVAFSRYMVDAKKMCKRTPREGPVLLGLQSFWEGVSIKGPYLLNVIITRMPFPVPSDPLFQKRQDRLGNRAFPVLSLYPVSISARQGTGRLLRTVKDAGIVAILDERVGTSRWGAQIIQELDVAENKFYSKPKMKKAWSFVDRYMNRMLDKTSL